MAEKAPPPASSARPPLPPTANHHNPTTLRPETYIIQVPKEQIYRVPPLENAYFVEQYTNYHNHRRQTRSFLPYLTWILSFLLILSTIVCGVILTVCLIAKLTIPDFSIHKLAIKNINQVSPWKKPAYYVTMKVRYPNGKMNLIYEGGGKAVLSHRGKEIGSGNPPEFYQGQREGTTIELVLSGSKKKASAQEIYKHLRGSKRGVRFELSLDYNVRLEVGAIKLAKKMHVECDLRVRDVAGGMRVVSQECSAKLQ